MIPHELKIFLEKYDSKEFLLKKGEVRKFKFFSCENVKLLKFSVSSYDYWLNGHLKDDPDETIEYEGYDLLKESEGYTPRGLFIYFPSFNKFGSHDSDHNKITLYDEANWSIIAKDFTWFINGMWYPNKIKHIEVNPWLTKSLQ